MARLWVMIVLATDRSYSLLTGLKIEDDVAASMTSLARPRITADKQMSLQRSNNLKRPADILQKISFRQIAASWLLICISQSLGYSVCFFGARSITMEEDEWRTGKRDNEGPEPCACWGESVFMCRQVKIHACICFEVEEEPSWSST